jgi:hypothetical protein
VRGCLLLKELGLAASAARRRSLLLKELEGSLLRTVASLEQLVHRTDSEEVLLAADNTPLVLHQILCNQAAARVLGRAVVNLRLAAHRHLRRLASLASVLAAEHFLLEGLHFL